MDVGVLSSIHQQIDRPYGSSQDPSSSGQSGVGMTGNKQNEDGGNSANRTTHYSMPGILHFLQTEWARFEMDRAQWEIDRAELQVMCYNY